MAGFWFKLALPLVSNAKPETFVPYSFKSILLYLVIPGL